MYHWPKPVGDAGPEELVRAPSTRASPPTPVLQPQEGRKGPPQKMLAYVGFGSLIAICAAAVFGYLNFYLGIAAGITLFLGALISWGLYVLDCEVLH